MDDEQKRREKHRSRFYVKLYTIALIIIVSALGIVFHFEIRHKFDSPQQFTYIEIYFSVYGGLIGSMLHILVFLPQTFRHLKHWSEEDRESNFCWLLLRPLLGGIAGFVSYAFINALPIQMDTVEAQRIFWFMFCVAVFAGFKSEDFIIRFSQRFESLIPMQKESGPSISSLKDTVGPSGHQSSSTELKSMSPSSKTNKIRRYR